MFKSSRRIEIDKIQSSEYSFPYHYLPSVNIFPNFSKSWGFAASYIAAINLFLEFLNTIKIKDNHKHMDFGCGDGGFVNAVSLLKEFELINFYGIDFDKDAIRWASIFSKQEGNFLAGDVANLPSSEYDSGSLVEVYEHIPPDKCENFLSSIANSLKKGAPLFVTVPSIEKRLLSKHYRHFNFEVLSEEFSKYFDIVNVYGFEKKTLLSILISNLSRTSWWYFESKITNKFLINNFSKKFSSLKGCGRIVLIVLKK